MSHPSIRFSAVGTLSITSALICWSSVPLFLKYFTHYIDSWTANGIRYPLAMLIWLPWLVRLARRGGHSRRFYLRAMVPAGVNLACQTLWAMAPYYIDPGLMSFVVRLNVIWAIIGAMLLFPEERGLLGSIRFWVGIVLGLVGFAIMGYYGGVLQGGATAVGILITAASSVGWGMYGVTVRWAMRGVDPREAFALIGGCTAAGTLILMATFGHAGDALAMPWRSMLLLVMSAMVGIAAAHVLFYAAMARLGVTLCSGLMLLVPFATSAGSWWLYGEQMRQAQWFGGIGLVAGAVVLIWAQRDIVPGMAADGDPTTGRSNQKESG